ncbi:unnamed protein product [Cuscuta campestris]|uniref:Acid phosphatase n=1 Tax=Cuscuta campestris TaxID=132261 RepID=A0A484LVW8_9ASTE|nr:unnamed protein product [Cuscuta campestris]
MSAYGHLMERGFSSHSLSSRGNSERGSIFAMETGIYMSSFAAIVFIAGLVTVGVSLVTLLVTLTVMLQSCQNKNSGPIESLLQAPESPYNPHYCLAFAMHIELNSLGSDSLPQICKDFAIQYIRDGQYAEDLNATFQLAVNFFNTVKPPEDGRSVVLMDVDDFLPEDLFEEQEQDCVDCTEDYAKYPKRVFVQNLYKKLVARGWKLVLVSRKPEKLRNATIEYLLALQCHGWSSLIMRKEHEMDMDTREYFFMQGKALQDAGFHVVAAISSRLDTLTCQSSDTRVFKLPNLVSISSISFIKATTGAS